jgi:NAD(P)-dependent dehydrogenase (short-subunit alcohol dehydrogenase family)
MLEGKSAIVTGSTSGIGLSVAGKLASQGANVTINGFGKKSEIDEIVSKVRHLPNIQRVEISMWQSPSFTAKVTDPKFNLIPYF